MPLWTCCFWQAGLWALSSGASSPWGSQGSGPRPATLCTGRASPQSRCTSSSAGACACCAADPDGEGPMVVEKRYENLACIMCYPPISASISVPRPGISSAKASHS